MKKLSYLIILIIITACTNTTNQNNTETTTTQKGVIEIAVFDVTGMHCDGCVNTITTVLTDIEGTSNAKVSLELEQAKVKFEPAKVTIEEMKAAIESKGYTVGEIEIIKLDKPAGEPVE